MSISEMTRADFNAVPMRDNWQAEIRCDSLVILPLRTKHDSGYRCMDFVACAKNEPICRLSGCSDVIHFEGIGGYGYRWLQRFGRYPDTIRPSDWNIDCLPKSGLLRIWSRHGLICGVAVSSFELYTDIQAKAKEAS